MKSIKLKCDIPEKNLSDNEIFDRCIKHNVRINRKIESGTYGVIYNAKYQTSSGYIDVAIKKIIENITGIPRTVIKKIIENIITEIKYCKIVGKHNIGPIVYDAFYRIENGDIITYIIMELFDNSVEKIYYTNMSHKTIRNIHLQMIKLMKNQIYNLKMFCTDIKPENFVLKKIGHKYKVRSIDYGPDWCALKKFPNEFKSIDYFYVVMLLLLCLNIFSHIRSENSAILLPFYEDKTVIRLTNNFKNFNKLKIILIKVVKSDDGDQVKHYFKDIVKEFTRIKYKDDEGMINAIIFIYNQIYFSIF